MSLLSRLAVSAARAYGALSSNPNNVPASYLVVAGGGGGGGITTNGSGGGGGAGGYLTSSFTLSTLNTYSITVGAGGTASVSGSNSVISGTGLTTVTSTGGGGGAESSQNNAYIGGSGGGGAGNNSSPNNTGAAGTSGQGNAGGTGGLLFGTTRGGGGGGGASAVGANQSGGGASGAGGAGTASSISGTSVTYAGGGGGGGTTGGAGGAGGGANGASSGTSPAPSGTANTGGGGGGGDQTSATRYGGSGGSGVVIISYTSATPRFVGGTLTTSGGNQIHTFTSSGTLSPLTPVTASYLVVAGGGAGGAAGSGGGGGAGGLLTSSTTLYSGATYVVTVGAGGAGTASGQGGAGVNSSIAGTGVTTITSTGGGGGGGNSVAGANGGSGGGGCAGATTAGTGISGQGKNGGTGSVSAGGGGGGSSAVGGNGAALVGGNGGAGTASSISGSSVTYAGGGGGYSTTGGTGGAGGGGNGNPTTAGTVNTGSGGGAWDGSAATSGAGGSGTVIISYAGSQAFNGGLVTSSGGNTIHTFLASGALTPLTNNLTNSLRFRASASAFLNRTPTATGNQKTFTWSGWVKRGALGSQQMFHHAFYGDSGRYASIYFTSSDTLQVQSGIYTTGASTSTSYNYITTQVFRDPSAWYHIVLAVDTTQATAGNRVKLYINGNQVTAFGTSTAPTQNDNTFFNITTTPMYVGKYAEAPGSSFLDGYLADINWVDGQQLEPYYFGNNDAYGNWKPILYKGTYGTNGFYLTFSDTSALTTSSNVGLGKDFSGNGNYWATNNISITAGVTYDAMTDVPTNTSATVANYAVMNPLKINGSAGTFSNGNLNVIVAGDSSNSGTIGFSSGKIYFEVQLTAAPESTALIGIADSNFAQAVFTNGGAINYGYVGTGLKGSNGSYVSYGATYTVNDIIGVAADLDAGTLVFYKNGVSQGTAYTSISGTFIPVVGNGNSGTTKTYVANFGQRPFTYTAPSGFVALNTFNLPTPTILQGNKYMDATVYSGSSTSGRLITNAALFQPDFVWVKNRTLAGRNHQLFDSVRGANKGLFSNLTIAESTTTQDITAFNSNGFTVGNDNNVNSTGDNFVGWQWQAGQGSSTSNTSGSITSTVSVNTTAGFSVATFTGNGTAGATIGHGLGVAPKMIFVKSRSATGDWWVYHASIGATKVLFLSLTDAELTFAAWNNTAPTSSVFTIGSAGGLNVNSVTQVAYCWAEIAGFSKFGSYTGNGSADGPFVFTGFRPKFVLIKRTNAIGNWILYDTARNTYNLANTMLFPNTTDADDTSGAIDILSNGFKTRSTNASWNGNGDTYIFMAFAENPFKNANAR